MEPTRALVAAASQWDILRDIKALEEPDKIVYYNDDFPAVTAKRVTKNMLLDLCESYGHAITVTIGPWEILESGHFYEDRWSDFLRNTQDGEDVRLILVLNKTHLLREWGAPLDPKRALLDAGARLAGAPEDGREHLKTAKRAGHYILQVRLPNISEPESLLRECALYNGPSISAMVGAREIVKDGEFNEVEWSEFLQNEKKNDETFQIEFTLDENRFCLAWGTPITNAVIKLFFFPETVLRTFGGLLLEKRDAITKAEADEGLIAESDGDRKLVLLVPTHNYDLSLDGDYLAVVGGKYVARWREYLPEAAPDATRVRELLKQAEENLNWTGFDLKQITPLHLNVAWKVPGDTDTHFPGKADPNDPIAAVVFAHSFACCVVYLACHSYRYPGGETVWRCLFRETISRQGDISQAEAKIDFPDQAELMKTIKKNDSHDPWAPVQSVANIAKWVYDDNTIPKDRRARVAGERLNVVQIVIGRYLQDGDAKNNCTNLLHEAKTIKQKVDWAWKAFVEGKLDKFFGRVREVEQAVESTVKTFNDQVEALTKTLVDNMLAAVGVLVVSLVAAVFKEPFNPWIFLSGTVLYAGYLAVFPIRTGLRSTRERFNNSVRSFYRQKRKFNERLGESQVSAIIGTTVKRQIIWFKVWFRRTKQIYYIVVLALFIIPLFILFVLLLSQSKDDFAAATAAYSASTGQLVIHGRGFRKEEEIVVTLGGGSYTNVNSQTLIVHSDKILSLTPRLEHLVGATEVLVAQGKSSPVPVGFQAPSIPLPVIEPSGLVFRGEIGAIAVRGLNLASISAVSFNGERLEHSIANDGTLMHIVLTKTVTDLPGEKKIECLRIDGATVNIRLTVQAKS
jgi:hypothetical protein